MAADPRRVKELFIAALDLPDPQARQAFLERECGADTDLRQRLAVLLKAHEEPASALDRPLAAGGPATASYRGSTEDVGAVLAGRYKLLEQIGEGGMGTVWVAEQTQPVRRKVAVKLLKAGMDSKTVLSRFEAERQALAVMDHPNIAKVLNGGTTESGRPFFVMEYVKGVPFTRYCDDARLNIAERLALFVPVCQAVQHAHQKGILHRDLKPSNILVCLYDGRPVPKVIDFGLAKSMQQPLTEHTLYTAHGVILGTPLYMSPEQAELNNLDVDTRTDIYALGVILYELLTGTTPLEKQQFEKAAWHEMLRLIKEEEPPRPSARLSGNGSLPSLAAQRQLEPVKLAKLVRGELDWIVMKCLEKDRGRRYETANGLARDLERYLQDEVVEAQPPTAGYRLRKFVRKHRVALTTAATIMLLLVAGVAVSTWQAVRATRAERDTAEALTRADDKRQEADRQRKKAETLAAGLAVDLDLKHCESEQVPLGVLRLAQTLRTTIPEDARELRECAALNMLAWGQQLRPAIAALDHDGYPVDQALLSPDGLTVLTRGQVGTARLWDSLTGKPRAILGEVWPRTLLNGFPTDNQLQFSRDGRTALTLQSRRARTVGNPGLGPTDWTVCLWDVATGRLRARTARHPGPVYDILLSQNNALLVTTCLDLQSEGTGPSSTAADAVVFAWNAANGQLIRKLELKGSLSRCAVSPDGRADLISAWHSEGGEVQVWFPQEGTPPKVLPGIKGGMWSVVGFSPSGRSAVTVTDDAVRWWNTSDWQVQHQAAPLSGISLPEFRDLPVFVHEDIVMLPVHGSEKSPPWVLVRNLPVPIDSNSKNPCRVSPDGALIAFDADDVYESRTSTKRFLGLSV
jgi:hypothetical protein